MQRKKETKRTAFMKTTVGNIKKWYRESSTCRENLYDSSKWISNMSTDVLPRNIKWLYMTTKKETIFLNIQMIATYIYICAMKFDQIGCYP